MKKTLSVFVSVLVLAALLLPGAAPARAEEPRPQIRAFWVDIFHKGAKSPAQIDQLVSDAVKANINTLVVQVRRRADVIYASELDPRITDDPDLDSDPNFDALQYLIEKAHAQNIEVHAWLNTLVAWKVGAAPSSPKHIWNVHGPNSPNAKTDQDWDSYYRTYNLSTKTWSTTLASSYYFDPGNPACADYTTETYLEVVRKYNVDGIHLDYARYCEISYDTTGTIKLRDYGYNPASVARFNERYGTTGLPNPADPRWADWRHEQVNNLMRQIYIKAVAIKPNIKVSCATIAWGAGPSNQAQWEATRAYSEVFQDWKGWLEEGIIDLAMPMNYDREWNATQKLWYNQWIDWEKNLTDNRQIVVGPAIYMQYIEQGLAQIERALAPSSQNKYVAGVALYAYGSANIYGCDDYRDPNSAASKALPRQPQVFNTETNKWFYNLLANDGGYQDPVLNIFIPTKAVFPTPAAIPDMPWKSHPTEGFLMGTVADFSGLTYDGLPLQVINQATGEVREVYTNGSGWFGAADLTPGLYRVTIGKEDFVGRRQIEAWVQPGVVTQADFQQFWQKGQSGFRYEQLDIDNSIEPEPLIEPDGAN